MIFSKLKIRKLWLWLCLTGIILILICYGLVWRDSVRVSWVDATRRKFLLYDGEIIDLFQERRLEQEFVANYPGLSRVDVLFRGNGASTNPVVIFHLKYACDGAADIGCDCTDGETRQCGTTDVGECEYGSQRCISGSWAACWGWAERGMETG